MKALAKSRAQRGLWLEDVPVPDVGINDVKIRFLLTRICGTDLHIYEWDEWAKPTIPVPMVIGHEFAGEIVAVGSNVTDYKMTVMLECGLDISPVITHHFSWRDHEQAFEMVRSGNSGKVILDWRDGN